MALTTSIRAALARNAPALGGAPLGNLYRAIADEHALAVVDAAWNAGVRYFDTAPHYGHGRSETRLGAALRRRPRHAFQLSTKVGRLLVADPQASRSQHGYVDTLPYVQRYDYTADGVRRSLDDSRARLGLDAIDFVYAHDCDRATLGDAFERHWQDLVRSGFPALAGLKAEGAIAGYGVGVNGVDICLRVLDVADPDVLLLAGRYTLADQQALAALLPACAERGVAVVLGGPFNSGILATGSTPVDGGLPMFDYAPASGAMRAHVAAIERVCAAHGIPLKAAALQFPRGHPAIACVLAGARSAAEMTENARLARLPIPAAFWRALVSEGLIPATAPLPPP
jgi:D-threo-aldose 1-dehydrogenase